MSIERQTFLPLVACLSLLTGGIYWSPRLQAKEAEPTASKEILDAANEVLRDPDGVNAGKNAGRVFEAAHAVLESGQRDLALHYFERGLQLSPWRLEEQLAYAELLIKAERQKEALSIAAMVDERAELDELCNHARRLLGKKPVPAPPAIDPKATSKPWVCLVRIGHVNQIVLSDTMQKLQEVLGIPVFLHSDTAELGKPHRSAFGRWMKQEIMSKIAWESPQAQNFLNSIGATSKNDVNPSKLLDALTSDLRRAGRVDQANGLEENAAFYRKHDQQWDASVFGNYGYRAAEGTPHLDQAIVFGITEADLYMENNNYMFGSGLIGVRKGIASYARYRAEFFSEPPDRARLVSRMHKLLLSTIGSSLNVPRPTDPTSARAYPSSLAEHDAKSEYMSEACISGFEKALGVTLPEAAHKPAGKR